MKLTPTLQRLYDILKDGELHPEADLRSTLNDDMACDMTLPKHISYLRKALAPTGRDVVYSRRGGGYRLVRHITAGE